MRAIHRYQQGGSTEARVCVERWLAILWRKVILTPSVSSHGRNSQLPGLAVVYTSLTVLSTSFKSWKKAWRTPVRAPCLKALFLRGQARNDTISDLQLKLHSFRASPPSTRPKTLLFCYSVKTSSLAFPNISALLLWQAGDASGQQVQGWRVRLPLPQEQTPRRLSCKPHPSSKQPGAHPVHFKSPKKDKIRCAR